MVEFDDVVAFFELVFKLSKGQVAPAEDHEQLIDFEALVRIVNEVYLHDYVLKQSQKSNKVRVNQLSRLYWVYANMGDVWDARILLMMESQLCESLSAEILELKLQAGDLERTANEQAWVEESDL